MFSIMTAIVGALATVQVADNDLESFLRKLEDAHRVRVPYTQVVEVRQLDHLPRSRDIGSFSFTEVRGLAGARLERREVTLDPLLGAMMDRTAPEVRDARGPSDWSLVTPKYKHVKHSLSSFAERSAVDAQHWIINCGTYVPAGLGATIAQAARQDASARIDRSHDAILLLLGDGRLIYTIDPVDCSVLSWEDRGDPNMLLRERHLDLAQSAIVAARLPRAKLTRAEWSAESGRPWFESLTIYDEPDINATTSKTAFSWSRYVERAVDRKSDTVYGPGDVNLGTVAQSSAGRHPPPSESISIDDLRSSGPSGNASVLPKSRDPLQTVLFVAGIASIILGITWSLRRKMT